MRGIAPAPGACPGPNCGSSWRTEQAISRWGLGRPAWFHPCTRAVPWAQLRKWLAGRTSNFPLQLGNRQSLPCVKGGGSRKLTEELYAPRRNLIAINDCNIANWLRHRRHAQTRLQKKNVRLRIGCGPVAPTGWAAERRRPDAKGIRGKRKNKRRKNSFSHPLFFIVLLHPWACLRSLFPSHAETSLFSNAPPSQDGCRGNPPAVG